MSILSLLGKQHSFNQQLETFRPRLYRIAYSWSHNPDLADDLVQETMVKALRKSEQVKNRESIDGWLFGILTNCWRDYFRLRKELDNIDNVSLVEETTPVHHVEQQNIVDKVRSAIANLPATQCQILTLVDLEGMSYAEVANVLDVPIGTVMSRLCRARKTLSGKLLEFQPETQKTASHLRRVK